MARIAGESPRTARHVKISPGIVADPVVLCCESAGGGPPVLLIHGLSDTVWVWRHLIPALSPRARVLALELRGHGRSSSPRGPYSAAEMSDDIHRLAGELSAKRPAIIAQGFGARFALLLAAGQPEFPSGLVLIGANTGAPAAALDVFKNHVMKGEMAAAYKAKREIIPPPRGMNPRERAEHHRLFMRNNPAGLAAAIAAAEEAPDLNERLGDIACPTLAVAGEFDEPRLPALEVMAANIYGCTAAIIEGAGHYPQLDAPEAFNAVLLEFLENHGLIDPRQ